MIQRFFFIVLITGLVFSCKNKPANEAAIEAPAAPKLVTHKLVQKWESDSLFKVPESVIFDSKNQVLYVANIEGTEPWGADGKGSIGKLGLDGKIIEAAWVKGLNAPKGMGIYNDKLYVADLKEIVVIDIATGKIENRIKVYNAVGLNDLSLDASGVIYVTDSQGKKLYRVEGTSSTIILDSLAGPNGVLVRGQDLFILNNGGFYKVNQRDKNITLLADGMEGGTDGLENIKEEDFIISCWAGAIWYLNSDGRKELLFDGKTAGRNTADIGLDAKNGIVYVPTFWKNSVMAFEIMAE